jgi:hypothetical protein
MAPAHDYPDEPHSAIGQRIMREIDGKIFSAWVFNNIPTGYTPGQPLSGYPVSYFFLDVEGADMRTNVWAHHYDPRPVNSVPSFVTNVGRITPSAVDALIQIVWPHDEAGRPQPETNARLANIGVDLAEHSPSLTTLYSSLGFDFNRQVRLLRSLNNGFLEFVRTADQITPHTGLNNLSWPRWEFDNVDVSAALDHNNTYYFAVQVDGVPTHTTIWVYGTDARTYFPHTDIPARSCQD